MELPKDFKHQEGCADYGHMFLLDGTIWCVKSIKWVNKSISEFVKTDAFKALKRSHKGVDK